MIKKALYIASIISILFNNGMSVYANSSFDETFFNLNNIIYYDAGNEECFSTTNGSTTLVGNDNAEKIWNFFKSKGFTDEQAAGFLGNIYGETGGTFDPSMLQDGVGPAAGIIQWENYITKSDRWLNLDNFAKSSGRKWDDLDAQLDFIMHELNGSESAAFEDLKSYSQTFEHATIAIERSYERSCDWCDFLGRFGSPSEKTLELYKSNEASLPRITKRIKGAADAYASFKGKGGSTSSSSTASSYTFIGDSLTVGVKSQLESSFSGSDVRAEVGQGINWALNQVANTKDIVVINLGTNDKFENGSALLEKLKDKKKVYLVDIYGVGGNTDYTATNTNIANAAKSFSNVEIISWKDYLDSNGGREKYYAEDGYHMNEEGKKLYLIFLKDKLNGSNSSNSGSDSCTNGNFSTSGDATLTTDDGFSIFLQTDKRWSEEYYTPKAKMGTNGCGPTAFTIIMNAFGIKANPLDVGKKAYELGVVYDGIMADNSQAKVLAKHYGLQAEDASADVDDINRRLDQGQLIWVGGSGMQPPFTSGGHMIVIRKKTPSGKWLIANPYDYPGFGISEELLDPMHEWNPSDVVRNMNMTPTAVWK